MLATRMRGVVESGAPYWRRALSPDGRWLAYSSNRLDPSQSPAWKVWVQPFPEVDTGLWQVSIGRGDDPVWAHNGRELLYNAGPVNGLELTVAHINLEPTFSVERQRVLFSLDGYPQPSGHEERLSPDDERFLMLRVIRGASTEPIVVDSWFEELKERVPR